VPEDCQRRVIGTHDVHALIGALGVYAYGEDVFKITPSRYLLSGPELKIADCTFAETSVDTFSVGIVNFGPGDGCNPCISSEPCIITPAVPVTWGKIKTLYR
jgi:hypothetical protein